MFLRFVLEEHEPHSLTLLAYAFRQTYQWGAGWTFKFVRIIIKKVYLFSRDESIEELNEL